MNVQLKQRGWDLGTPVNVLNAATGTVTMLIGEEGHGFAISRILSMMPCAPFGLPADDTTEARMAMVQRIDATVAQLRLEISPGGRATLEGLCASSGKPGAILHRVVEGVNGPVPPLDVLQGWFDVMKGSWPSWRDVELEDCTLHINVKGVGTQAFSMRTFMNKEREHVN